MKPGAILPAPPPVGYLLSQITVGNTRIQTLVEHLRRKWMGLKECIKCESPGPWAGGLGREKDTPRSLTLGTKVYSQLQLSQVIHLSGTFNVDGALGSGPSASHFCHMAEPLCYTGFKPGFAYPQPFRGNASSMSASTATPSWSFRCSLLSSGLDTLPRSHLFQGSPHFFFIVTQHLTIGAYCLQSPKVHAENGFFS